MAIIFHNKSRFKIYPAGQVGQGFTLIEVLIALVIVGIGVSAIYGLYMGLSDTIRRTCERVEVDSLLSNGGEYATLMELFPREKDAAESVRFTYQEHEYTIARQNCAEQSMIKKTGLIAYRLTLDQEGNNYYLTYLVQSQEPKQEQKQEQKESKGSVQPPAKKSGEAL